MKAIFPVLAVLILGVVYLIVFSPIFKVKEVFFYGDQPSCAIAEEVGNASMVKGMNLWFLDSIAIEKKIKDKFFCIRSANLHKTIPNKVNFDMKNRKAVLTLIPAMQSDSTESAKPKQTGEPLIVDSEGVIFINDLGQSNQPMVYFLSGDLTIGKKLESKLIQKTVQVLDKLKSLGLNVDNPQISSSKLTLGQKPKVVFILDDKIERQLASLQLILDQAKMDTKEIDFIDLGFEKPVVRYAPKK